MLMSKPFDDVVDIVDDDDSFLGERIAAEDTAITSITTFNSVM